MNNSVTIPIKFPRTRLGKYIARKKLEHLFRERVKARKKGEMRFMKEIKQLTEAK